MIRSSVRFGHYENPMPVMYVRCPTVNSKLSFTLKLKGSLIVRGIELT